MDAKITLSFDKSVIENAKRFAADNNMSLSRLTEFLLRQVTTGQYKSLEEFPIAEWVEMVSEGAAEYHTTKTSRKKQRAAFYSKK